VEFVNNAPAFVPVGFTEVKDVNDTVPQLSHQLRLAKVGGDARRLLSLTVGIHLSHSQRIS
jgi:hypothetical protein